MAITINTQPEHLTASEDIIAVKATTDEYVLDAGDYYELILEFDSKFIINETLTLNVDGEDYIFEALAADDEQGNSIPVGTPFPSIDDWVKATVDDINRNPFISKHYIVQSDVTDRIRFVAREKGNVWNINWSSTNVDVFEFDETLGALLTTSNNFKIILNLYYQPVFSAEPSYDEFIYYDTLELPPDDSGAVVFYLQRILKRMFDIGINDIPSLSLSGITLCLDTIRNYYYSIGEQYGTPPVEYAVIPGAIKQVINGGFGRRTAALQPLYSEMINIHQKFLSLHPLAKHVRTGQHEYLYYYHNDPGGNYPEFQVRVMVYDMNGVESDVGPQTYLENLSAKPFELFYFPVSYDEILSFFQESVEGFSGGISKYDVWIEVEIDSEGTAYTEVRTYIVDFTAKRFSREFCFRNPFGVYEFITLYGRKAKGIRVNKTLFNSVLKTGYSAEEPQIKVIKTDVRQDDVVGGRMRNRKEAEWFMGFLNSKDIREVLNDKYIPVTISNNDDQVWKDAMNLNSFLLKISGAFNEENLTDVAD